MSAVIEIRPQEGRQTQFLASPADIVIFGGAAGGGKTWGLLLEPLRHIHNSEFGAVIFRRTFKQVTMEGGMWDESEKIYPYLGARPVKGDLYWEFPSRAKVSFAHLQYEQNKLDYQGAQIALIGFDQLEHFSEGMFFYMLTRNRSTSGVRPYIRATCNPDPESWLAKFIDWWIAEDGYADLERVGAIRWFIRQGNQIVWADSPDDLAELGSEDPPKSVTFIPSSVYDNKILLKLDPGYLANLKAQPLVDRERLLGDPVRGGNWKIKPEAGKVFNRAWFDIVPAAPAGGVTVRYWDFAATEKELASDDPDYSAGVLMRKVRGEYYILDCIAVQAGPAEVDKTFVNIALQDANRCITEGSEYRLRWEVEPGSAGKREARRMAQMVAGIDAKGAPVSEEKIVRAKPLAAQAEVGNVHLVAGPWNEEWLDHMHNQPDWPHDDILDGSSGAFNELTDIQDKTATAPARAVKAESVFG